MEIMKHGKKDTEKVVTEDFECNKCGCKFSVAEDEYYVEKGQQFSQTDSLVYSFTSVVADIYICSCPECHKIITKTKQRIIENPSITLTKNIINTSVSGIPDACRNCSNHPNNGGSGICHCIMGGMANVTYDVSDKSTK